MDHLSQFVYQGALLGASTLAAINLVNNTAATVGAQQVSPATYWEGKGWKTAATAGSQSVRYRAYVEPIQGTSAPDGMWRLQTSIAGGAFANGFNVYSDGSIGVQGEDAQSGVYAITIPANRKIRSNGGSMSLVTTVDLLIEIGSSRFLTLTSPTNILNWTGQSRIYNNADGVLMFTDDAATSFSRLALGGSTSSYPAIKRNGAALNFRLADDSANAAVTMGALTASGTVTLSNYASGFLQVDGSGVVSVGTPAGSGYTIVNVTTTSSSPAQTSGDIILLVNTTTAGGNVTINLPTAVGNTARFTIKKIDSASNTVTVDANGTQTIDGALTIDLRGRSSATLVSNNANWFII